MFKKLSERVHFIGGRMEVTDWIIFKLVLAIFGIIIGMYFADFFLQYKAILWIAFLVGFIYMVYVFFGDLYEEKKEENMETIEKGEENNVDKQ
ncbi:MAG: hypothetical protein PHH22_01920 [Clostridia bacterium]|nr:hypothetical protein [Clostridia bacterium]